MSCVGILAFTESNIEVDLGILLFGISSYLFCLISQIKINQWEQTVVISKIQLCSSFVIILPHGIRHQIIENPDFTIAVVFSFWIKVVYYVER